MKKMTLNILITSIYLGTAVIFPIKVECEDKKFELKKMIVNEKKDKNDRPLFDLINSNQPDLELKNDNRNKWGNNPFFNEQPAIIQKQAPTQEAQTPTTLNLFEYKIVAVWEIDKKYKVLISGHILEEGEKLNNITIKKITTKEITVQKKKKSKTFRLGSIFYDFQI